MKRIIIDDSSAGQRLDRFLGKLLPQASKGLIQKSLRKKNVRLNGAKAAPNDILREGDEVKVFFSDETFGKLSQRTERDRVLPERLKRLLESPAGESEDFIALNKPAGILTQPDRTGDPSVADLASLLAEPGSTFRPAPLNRLDRNTSGIVIIPKTYSAQKEGARMLRDRRTQKLYKAIVIGELEGPGELRGRLKKDSEANKVTLGDDGREVSLKYRPIKSAGGLTLLEVELETGKPHQIRAQLAQIGHPVLGDPKYGDREKNAWAKRRFGVASQLLHAFEYTLFSDDGTVRFSASADVPKEFERIVTDVLGD